MTAARDDTTQTNSRTPTPIGQAPQRKAAPNPDSAKNPAKQGGRPGDDDDRGNKSSNEEE